MVAFQRKISVKMMKINTWNRLFVTIFGGYINFCRCSHSGYHYIGKSCTVVIWRIFWRIYWCWLCQVICTRDIVIVAWQRANLLKVRFCQKVLMFFWHLPNRRKFYFLELENLNFSDWNLLRNWECRKIHIFWEGHKILLYLHLRFVLCSNVKSTVHRGGDFAKFCGLLRRYEL